ncbi:uncharacterized protein LOC126735234 [Anthonomus grandis grandis]|uniref:uncharacterized protein LOC126735234 n=1 Tax=Anthonomus grandis grandis TaxID=2921223 RepID=UPI002165AA61|nr:uncharacterized protein LOC126735234 [Anthonomus grandis grandis]
MLLLRREQMDEEDRWDEVISKVRWGLNSAKNSTTGKSPYELFFGYAPRGVADAVLANEVVLDSSSERNRLEIRNAAKEKIDQNQRERKARFDKQRCLGQKFTVGSQVLVRTFLLRK